MRAILIFADSIGLLFFIALGVYITKEVKKDIKRQKEEQTASSETTEEETKAEMKKEDIQECIKKMYNDVLIDEYLEKKFEDEIEQWIYVIPRDKHGRQTYKPFEDTLNTLKVTFKNGKTQLCAVRTADLYKKNSESEGNKPVEELTPEEEMVEILVKRTLARIITSSEKAKASGFCQISLSLDDEEFKNDKSLASKVARKISSTSSEYTVNVDEAEENHLIVSWIDTSAMDDFDLQDIA